MTKTVGIRKEDKNRWERRVPLIPPDLAGLAAGHGVRFVVEPSPIRAFSDDDYRAVGADIRTDLAAADIILAIKEVPAAALLPNKVYVYFAHVTKGQPYNMTMLARLMELGCTLIDYERIVDDKGRRLIFFGRYAGHAGAIDTLRCLGQRLLVEGYRTPLAEVRFAHDYRDFAEALTHLADVGRRLEYGGLPEGFRPLVFGIAGYGHVSLGVQDVLDALPAREVSPAALPSAAVRSRAAEPAMLEVVFKEEDMVRPADPGATFELSDYYKNPERYVSRFEDHLPHLDVLFQTIYWTPRYPRFVTCDWARRSFLPDAPPRLRVIGDISCDIGGSIEMTVRTTTQDAPCYVWDPRDGSTRDGVTGHGPVLMTVDNLPCELPRESSGHFSSVLRGMVPELLAVDWGVEFGALALPPHLKRAVVVHRGALTPDYQYLQQFVG